MSSILLWGAIIIGGSFVYIGMGGQPSKKEQKEEHNTEITNDEIAQLKKKAQAMEAILRKED